MAWEQLDSFTTAFPHFSLAVCLANSCFLFQLFQTLLFPMQLAFLAANKKDNWVLWSPYLAQHLNKINSASLQRSNMSHFFTPFNDLHVQQQLRIRLILYRPQQNTWKRIHFLLYQDYVIIQKWRRLSGSLFYPLVLTSFISIYISTVFETNKERDFLRGN